MNNLYKKSDGKLPNEFQNLRQRAEKKRLTATDNIAPETFSSEEVLRLVHELQVHQIELEMQNEELRKEQTELQELQAKYYDLYEQAPVGYLILDAKGYILESNATAAGFLGVEKSTLVKKLLSRFIVPEDQDIYYFHCQQLLQGKEHNACELRLLVEADKQINVSLEATTIRADASQPLQFRMIISNITQRKRAETELQHSQSRLLTIIDTAFDAFITINSQGIILMFNKAAEAMFGYVSGEIIGHNFNKLIPSPYFEEHRRYFTNSLRNKPAIGTQRGAEGQRKDGSIFPLSFSVGEFRENDQLFYTAILQDFSERKQAEAILESEQRLAVVLEASAIGFWEWDIQNDQTLHDFNWFKILGLKENTEAYAPKFFSSLIHEDDRDTVLAKLNQVLEGSGRFQSEHRLRHSDGHYFWVQENGIVVKRDHQGQPLRMVGSFMDISKRKQQEQHQREYQHQYERMLKLEVAQQTIAAIAHELNQPLNAAASFADAAQRFLQKEVINEKKLNLALDQSAQQIQRAGKVVHDLFNFLQTGKTLTMPLDLNKVVSSVIATLKSDGYFGKFTAVLDLVADLPKIRSNELQLEKVLANLINNSIEAMTDAGLDKGSIVVTVGAAADSSHALVSICDSGPGLAAESAQRIFDPFYTTKAEGLGMGLAICRALIEAQGRQLWCQANEGIEGASFHLTLPFASRP